MIEQMTEEDMDAYASGIEMACDWNLEVTNEQMSLYKEIIDYRKEQCMKYIDIYPREWTFIKIISDNLKRGYIKKSKIAYINEVSEHWARTTVYTMLDRLKNRGILKEKDGLIFLAYDIEKLRSMKLKKFIEDIYDGNIFKLMLDLEKVK